MKNTYSLKNEHHDFNIERFRARLMGKCCVVFICICQIIIRVIILATEPKLDYRSRIAHVVSLPFVLLIALIICFEYILFRRIGPKVMKYSKLIDITLLILFTIEWLITLFIIFIRFSNTHPPTLAPSAIFAITNFGWRTLFLLFLIQGWKLISLSPTIAMFFTLGFTLYYSTTGPKLILMACLSQVLYTIIMLYFLDKIKWKEIFTNAQQERWMQINQFVLNNIPENIVILELGGGVNFISDYCKAFMQSVHLSHNPQDLFTHINQLYLQPDTQPTSPCNVPKTPFFFIFTPY